MATRCHAATDGIIYQVTVVVVGAARWGLCMYAESLLVYPAPHDPPPAATSIITLEECRTLVLNSL